MKDENVLSGLEDMVGNLSIDLRYELGDFIGGIYRYHDKEQFIINRELNVKQKINILACELKRKLDFDNTYMVPALREVIDNASNLE